MKTIHLAIITGMGIAIIVAATVFVMFVMNPAPHAEVRIEGLHDKYIIGEKLDFVVAAKGYGIYCDGPSVEIYNGANQSHFIWGGSYMLYTGMYCNPHDFDYVFHVGEWSSYSLSDKVPIILDKPGTYAVKAHMRISRLTTSYSEQEFSVAPQEPENTVYKQPSENDTTNAKSANPLGITALVIYHPFLGCLSYGCPPNNFYLKINSNSSAYLFGYDVCNEKSCIENNTLSIPLPINSILKPEYARVWLPKEVKWSDGDAVHIQLRVSPLPNNRTAIFLNLGNSTIVP